MEGQNNEMHMFQAESSNFNTSELEKMIRIPIEIPYHFDEKNCHETKELWKRNIGKFINALEIAENDVFASCKTPEPDESFFTGNITVTEPEKVRICMIDNMQDDILASCKTTEPKKSRFTENIIQNSFHSNFQISPKLRGSEENLTKITEPENIYNRKRPRDDKNDLTSSETVLENIKPQKKRKMDEKRNFSFLNETVLKNMTSDKKEIVDENSNSKFEYFENETTSEQENCLDELLLMCEELGIEIIPSNENITMFSTFHISDYVRDHIMACYKTQEPIISGFTEKMMFENLYQSKFQTFLQKNDSEENLPESVNSDIIYPRNCSREDENNGRKTSETLVDNIKSEKVKKNEEKFSSIAVTDDLEEGKTISHLETLRKALLNELSNLEPRMFLERTFYDRNGAEKDQDKNIREGQKDDERENIEGTVNCEPKIFHITSAVDDLAEQKSLKELKAIRDSLRKSLAKLEPSSSRPPIKLKFKLINNEYRIFP